MVPTVFRDLHFYLTQFAPIPQFHEINSTPLASQIMVVIEDFFALKVDIKTGQASDVQVGVLHSDKKVRATSRL